MKKILSILCLCTLLWSSVTFGAVGDTVPSKYNAIWQIAASGLTSLMSKMDGIPDAYQATHGMTEWEAWVRLEYAQPGSLGKVFPSEVYSFIIGRFVGYDYGDTEIYEDFVAPVCSGGSGQITCDEDTLTSRDVMCYSWNFVDYTELTAGTLNAGTWTFDSLSAGNYVCTFSSNFDALPTSYLTVT